uniref:Uncharacterized protein n=1 Tax=Ciona savignyi TaxID=51511 RepID=H2ZC96_CIOSA
MPGVYVSIEPMSTGLARSLFAEIETPATAQEQQMFHSIAELWELLSIKNGVKNPKTKSRSMQNLLNDYQKVKLKRKSSLRTALNKELTPMETWQEIYNFSVHGIKELSSQPTNTIGAFYLRVILFTSMLESCTQMNALNGSNASPTIFTGNVEWQVNMDAWHNPEDQTDSNDDSLEGSANIPISSLYTPLFP